MLNFRYQEGETFPKAWDRLKKLTRRCPKSGLDVNVVLESFYGAMPKDIQQLMNQAGDDQILSMPMNESFPILDKLAWELANKFKSKPLWVRADEIKRPAQQRPGRYEVNLQTKEAAN